MKRLLLAGNMVAIVVVLAFGIERYVAPRVAESVYGDRYKELVFQCDHVMREHFIAKQMVLAATNEETIRNLDTAEIGLTACHEYDMLRKRLGSWGVSESALGRLGLEAIEDRARDVRTFVEIHEIRY